MKKVTNLHGGTQQMLTAKLRTALLNRSGGEVVRKTINMPGEMHALVDEIAFQEEITLKQFMVNALSEFLASNDTTCNMYRLGADAKHPTVILDRVLVREVRALSHTSRQAEKDIFCEAVKRYADRHFREKYPQLF